MHHLEKYQVCIDFNGIWGVLSWAQKDMYSNKLGLQETCEEYRNRVFCKLLSEPFDKMYMTQDQGHREKWVQKSYVSFEEGCIPLYVVILKNPN